MLMDEMVQKGWGVGSGLSLFIMAGIAQTILWSGFSVVPGNDGPVGILPFVISHATDGRADDAIFRTGQLPSLFGLGLTATVTVSLLYVAGPHVGVPIGSATSGVFTAVHRTKP